MATGAAGREKEKGTAEWDTGMDTMSIRIIYTDQYSVKVAASKEQQVVKEHSPVKSADRVKKRYQCMVDQVNEESGC